MARPSCAALPKKCRNTSTAYDLQRRILQGGRQDSPGLGHPEALIGGNDITYSRHITANDRIIYDIYDDRVSVLVIQAEEHYNDK